MRPIFVVGSRRLKISALAGRQACATPNHEVGMIDRTDIFDDFKTPRLFPTDPRKDPWLMSATAQGRRAQLLEAEDFLSTVQQEEAERSAAIKRVLSELTNLSLYEKRAAARRDRNIRKLMKIKQTSASKVEK